MYSLVVDDKVLDFKYKRSKSLSFIYSFYLGDIFIGQLFHLKNKTWSAVSFKVPDPMSPVYGFKNKYYASEYLLKVCGYMKK